MAGFDPDAYLASTAPAAPSFDPDAYLASTQAPSAPVTAGGLQVQSGIGLAKGAIGLAGAPADTNTINKSFGSYIGDKLGISPETQSKIGTGYDYAAKVGALGPLANLGTITPGTEKIKSTIESQTGPFRAAQNEPERLAERTFEFVPALLGNRGSLVRNALTNVVGPAVASELAGHIPGIQGTAAQPYVEAAAGLASPLAAEGIAARRAASAATRAVTPPIDQTLASASAGYKSPEVTDVVFKPKTVEDISNMVKADLTRSKRNERLAGPVHDILDEMKTPINGVAHTYEDIQTTRELLGEHAGNFANKPLQGAATQAIKTLDRLVETLPQSKLASGDIGAMNTAIENARGNYASGMTAKRVSEKIRNADLAAASTYSGGNLNNATRQKLRPLLTTKSGSRGLTPDELQTIEDTVRGSTAGNIFRGIGKTLGGSGGFPAAIAGGVGHMFGGPAGAAALLGAGYATRKLGDAITRANANKITNQILARSPLGLQRAAAQPSVAPADGLNLLRALLLSNAATLPSRMPSTQTQP